MQTRVPHAKSLPLNSGFFKKFMDSRSKKTTCVVFFAPSGLCVKKDMCVLITQSCLTHCDPMNCSLPGSSVLGILQARILEWVAIFFSRGSSQPRDQTWISYFAGRFFTTESPGKPWKDMGEAQSPILSRVLQGGPTCPPPGGYGPFPIFPGNVDFSWIRTQQYFPRL